MERVLIWEKPSRRSGYEWSVLKPLGPGHLFATVTGVGDFATDEQRWRELIESVELHSLDLEAIEPTKRSAKRPQGKRQRTLRQKLDIALRSLPDELKYLSPAVLALSAQDSDSILAGDADVTVLEQVIATATATLPASEARVLISSHHKRLHDWLERHPDRAKPYFSVLHTVEGWLEGSVIFSEPAPTDQRL